MKTYARIEGGTVAEIVSLDDNVSIADAFHSSLTFIEAPANVAVGWSYGGTTFSEPAPASLDDQKVIKSRDVDDKIVALLSAGAPVTGGLHVALDDSSRADMGSMATTALASTTGAVAWPDSYKEGWISIENTRIPLATPDDGLTLAAGVGDFYAKARQNGRSLKDAIAVAAKQSDLDAVDVDSGWPA